MKFTKNNLILLSLSVTLLLGSIFTKSLKKKASLRHHDKQVNLVRDMNGFNSDIGTVFRRDPSVSTVTKLGNYRLQPVSNTISVSNSNTSSLPNVGYLGQTAELVGPHVVLHSKTPISVIKETPAHVGWRNDQKTITSLNLETGKAEHHTLNNKTPIYGNVEEVKTVYKNEARSYDIQNRRFTHIPTTITHQ